MHKEHRGFVSVHSITMYVRVRGAGGPTSLSLAAPNRCPPTDAFGDARAATLPDAPLGAASPPPPRYPPAVAGSRRRHSGTTARYRRRRRAAVADGPARGSGR